MPNHLCITNKADCTGCRACEQLCPQGCISMQADHEGFLYPLVDENTCIDCGICVRHCPQNFMTVSPDALAEPLVYAAKLKDRQTLLKSSSGGMFSALAEYVLEQDGVVFGVVFGVDMAARHVWTDAIGGLGPMRRSKYVQSDTMSTFSIAKKFLRGGRTVLYTGCPCQIAGLRSFLGKDYPSLLTVDVVCGGTPSPKLFRKYIEWFEQKYRCKIISHEFRSKERVGWGLGTRIVYETTIKDKIKHINTPALDPYFHAYLQGNTLRQACYKCHYVTKNRTGDFTLADYWGIEKYHPKFYDKGGASLVLINTLRASELLSIIEGRIELLPSTLEYGADKNRRLCELEEQPAVRDLIYAQIDRLDFAELAKQYLFPTTGRMLFSWLKSVTPTPIKKQLKRLLTVFKH